MTGKCDPLALWRRPWGTSNAEKRISEPATGDEARSSRRVSICYNVVSSIAGQVGPPD
jgi:hypothetical protein